MNHPILALIALSAVLSSPSALAAGTGSELEQQIYSSAGIASPGFNTGLNAAGFAYNVTSKFALLGTYANTAAGSPYSVSPGVIFASRFITGGLSYTYPSNGLALNLAGLPGRWIALGVAVTSTVSTLGTFVFSPGVIFNPFGRFRVGAFANTTLANISNFGAGISIDPARWLRLTVDGTSLLPFNNVTLTPGLTVGGMSWRLTGAYAYTLGGVTNGTSSIQLGLGVALGNSFFLQLRTSGFSSYFGGFEFKLAK